MVQKPTEKHKRMKTALAEFEASNLLLPAEAVHVVGVVAGVKPAATVYLPSDRQKECTRMLKALGLEVYKVDDSSLALSFDLGKAEELANLMRQKTTSLSRPEMHKLEYRVGELLGYPRTTTEAYLARQDQYYKTGKLPIAANIPSNFGDVQYFQQIILSSENMEAEIRDYVEPLQLAFKQLTPRLYKQYFSDIKISDRD